MPGYGFGAPSRGTRLQTALRGPSCGQPHAECRIGPPVREAEARLRAAHSGSRMRDADSGGQYGGGPGHGTPIRACRTGADPGTVRADAEPASRARNGLQAHRTRNAASGRPHEGDQPGHHTQDRETPPYAERVPLAHRTRNTASDRPHEGDQLGPPTRKAASRSRARNAALSQPYAEHGHSRHSASRTPNTGPADRTRNAPRPTAHRTRNARALRLPCVGRRPGRVGPNCGGRRRTWRPQPRYRRRYRNPRRSAGPGVPPYP